MSIKVSSADGMGSITISGTTATTTGMGAEDHMHVTRGFGTEGVISKGDFQVTENGTPNRTVNIAAGELYVANQAYNGTSVEETKFWNVKSDATVNVSIDQNTSGNPRYTSIFLKLDAVTSPDSEATNIASLVAVNGTPAASPTVPGFPDATNGYLRLADILLPNGYTTIQDSDITDRRTYASLGAGNHGGYTSLLEYSPAYQSAGVVRFASVDLTGIIGAGNYIKLEQPTAGTKYFYVSNVSLTSGNTDVTLESTVYTLANEGIYQFYFSYGRPVGFPSPISVDSDGDLNISGDTNHTVIDAGTSKLVKIKVLRQDDTTDSYEGNTVILSGWGYTQGDGDATTDTKTVSFGITFSVAPVVIAGNVGFKDTTAPTSITQLGITSVFNCSIGGITTSQFDINSTDVRNTSIAATRYVGHSWIAVGQLN